MHSRLNRKKTVAFLNLLKSVTQTSDLLTFLDPNYYDLHRIEIWNMLSDITHYRNFFIGNTGLKFYLQRHEKGQGFDRVHARGIYCVKYDPTKRIVVSGQTQRQAEFCTDVLLERYSVEEINALRYRCLGLEKEFRFFCRPQSKFLHQVPFRKWSATTTCNLLLAHVRPVSRKAFDQISIAKQDWLVSRIKEECPIICNSLFED